MLFTDNYTGIILLASATRSKPSSDYPLTTFHPAARQPLHLTTLQPSLPATLQPSYFAHAHA